MMQNLELLYPKRDLGIEVVSGCVWLTHLGCHKDTILGKGDKAKISTQRGGLLMALGSAEVRLQPGASKRPSALSRLVT